MTRKTRYESLSGRPADRPHTRAFHRIGSIFGHDATPDRLLAARRDAQVDVATGRRFAFAGIHGGAGTTSLVVATAQALALARGGSVAVASMHDPQALEWFAGTGTASHGVHVHPSPLFQDAASIADLSRAHQVLLVDCNLNLAAAEQLTPHASVIVGRHTVRGKDTVRQVRDGWQRPEPTIGVLRHISDAGMDRVREGVQLGDTAEIPHDRHLAGEAAVSLNLCAEPTRIAVEELAALAMRLGAQR